ncbi:CUTL [Acanthosepion pharaonis]|uniref:DNA-binding protein SATB n=1 Tax=Acanthosepion pharaonis TaxID=158019 RepID=A0A812CKB5_ACAPH|nr:CUTL [Sepia pharaonis]
MPSLKANSSSLLHHFKETIKELTAKLKDYDDQLEAKTEARFKEKEKEIQKTFDEKERLLQETQLTLSNKLGEAEQKVSALHSALESAQAEIQRQKAKYDEVVEAKSSRSDAIKETSSENLRSDDMEMVIKDLERANERAEASEREVEQLRQQLASATQNLHQVEQMEKATDMEQALDILKRSRLEVELAAKDKEITQLIEDIQRLQASYDSLQESTSARISRLEENINRKDKAFRLLEEMFRSQKEFEDIKCELSSMKSTEFANVSDDDCPLETSNSLELLLLEKAKNQEQQQPAQPQQTSEAQPLNLTESDSTASNTNSTPLTTTTEAFATMLGEELVTSYQQHNQSGSSTASTPTSNGLPPSSDNHPPPPSPHNHSSSSSINNNNNSNSTTNHVPFSPSSTNCQMPPPPTSQFLSYGNGHSPATHHYMPPSVVVKQEPNSGTTTPSNGKNQSLDTALVAKMVRELLSVHNIGQRLFAKHILGLSQGTVSELLSKPKSWDKLTEKGRESYRKMHAWAVDESNILALKAISPKKTGSQALVPSSQREDSATEERITQILNAAQQAMQMKKSMDHTKNFTSIQHAGNKRSPPIAHDLSTNMSHQLQVSTSMALNAFKEHSKNSVSSSKASVSTTNGTSTVSSTGQSSPSHANMNSSSRNRSESSSSTERKHGHKSLSSQSASSKERELAAKEMVTRIYREELTKLAQAAESAGNVAASTMYQQELARIAQNIHRSTPMQQQLHDNYHHQDNISIKTEPPDSTSDENSLQANGPIDLSKPHSSPQTPTTETTFADSGRHTGSAFCLVRPRLNGQDNYESSRFSSYLPSDCLSPLQRMQNIANSLTTRSHIGTPSTKPLKAVLPPITQEQFDKYSNIDTDILVKQVKETLSQYSISQRLFGENVLGLSQGSVSDLLARPKPWHMLTQKGREPFIRMQIFLEDGEAIPKLVASQYRIPPDKLMRNNSQNQESSSSECLSDNQQSARRRRSSIDDRCFDAPTAPKRPRIFFTEEQKEILRQAYAQDPYPNQNTIEGLAAELNVGVKTVINWFHNHRMRAKQQQHPVSNSNSNSQGDGQFSVKTEPNEDSSNHSESSIISETAPDRSGDGGQWMFPNCNQDSSLYFVSSAGQRDKIPTTNNVPCLSLAFLSFFFPPLNLLIIYFFLLVQC